MQPVVKKITGKKYFKSFNYLKFKRTGISKMSNRRIKDGLLVNKGKINISAYRKNSFHLKRSRIGRGIILRQDPIAALFKKGCASATFVMRRTSLRS